MNIFLQSLELSVFTAVSKLQDLFAILCAALLAYYYLLTSMTVSYCKVLMSGPSVTCLVEYSEHSKTPACSGSVNICDDNSMVICGDLQIL